MTSGQKVAKPPALSAAEVDNIIDQRLAFFSFWEFCLFYDNDFFVRRHFLKEVADAFQQVYENYTRGRSIKVAVSMPPRAGKSYITSLFCAWWLGKLPTQSVMRNTCTARLYNKFSYDVRNVVKSTKFRKVFAGVALAPDKQNIDGWNLTTSKQVGYFGGGVGGTIIGFGANLAISDDLYKDITAALSETVQEGVSAWKQSAHNSRMEKNCPEIFIGTRWTMKDEIGKALDTGKIDIAVKISAMVIDETGQLKSFCEDVKSTAEYLQIKQDTEESIWAAEYDQNPVELKGLLFPASSLKYFSPFDATPEYKYASVDPADTGGDDLSAPFADLHENKIFITDVIYSTDGTDITIPEIVEKVVMNKLNAVEIEGNSAWILFGKDVRTKVQERYEECDVRIIKAMTNKHTRILAQSAFIRNHFYFLAEQYWTPAYRRFMKVLTSYMKDGSTKRDDAPDSLVMVAQHFKKNFSHLW